MRTRKGMGHVWNARDDNLAVLMSAATGLTTSEQLN